METDETKPILLQLCPLIPRVQQRIDGAFTTLRPAPAGLDAAWLAQHAADIQGVITSGDVGLPKALADALPRLGVIAINGVGFDRIDLAAAARRGIRISNTPDVLTDDVADLAIGLMISVRRGMMAAERHVRSGEWTAGPFMLTRKASGARYGIFGLGRIGVAIAARLAGFGGSIAYTARSRKDVDYTYHRDARSLAAASDVLIVAAAASPATAGMIDASVLEALGKNGILVNIARGSIVDEPALVQALLEGRIAGAGLDVFAHEPHVPPELLAMPNVVLLPHIGAATAETRAAMGDLLFGNLEAFFAGRPLLTEVSS